jgi:hypothetical protein
MLVISVDEAGIITNFLLYACNFILFSKLHWDISCFSALMASKLSEMDEVVRMIHTNILQNLENDQGQTLLVCVVTIFLLLF